MTTREKPPKPPGKIKRAIRRKKAAAFKAARPYLASLAAAAVLAVALHVFAPALQWLAVLVAGAVLGIAADRFREHLGWYRACGRAARRMRSHWQGTPPSANCAASSSTLRACRSGPSGVPGEIQAQPEGRPRPRPRRRRVRRLRPPAVREVELAATVGLEAPGACLFTSTRADLAVHTAAVRARGDRPAYFINPGLDGGFPCTCTTRLSPAARTRCWQWNPPALIMPHPATRAAPPRGSTGNPSRASSCSCTPPHCPAVTSSPSARAADIASPEIPLKILDARGTPGWADELASLAGEAADDPQTASGILGGITGAPAGWLIRSCRTGTPGTGGGVRRPPVHPRPGQRVPDRRRHPEQPAVAVFRVFRQPFLG